MSYMDEVGTVKDGDSTPILTVFTDEYGVVIMDGASNEIQLAPKEVWKLVELLERALKQLNKEATE